MRERKQVNLWNPAATVLANIDKRYLAALRGCRRRDCSDRIRERAARRQSLRTLLERRNWTRAVVKPAVSASAYGTWRTSLATAAADQRQLDEEVMRRSLLVQPFADEIVTSGEWSVVFFDGEYSHAVLKKPAAGDFRVQEELGGHGEPRDPSPAIVEQARRVLSHAAGPLLYARVDGIERDGAVRPDGAGDQRTVSLHWLVERGRGTLRGRDCSHDRQNPVQSAVSPPRQH